MTPPSREEILSMNLCALPNCGRRRYGRQPWCSKHYQRWRKHGDPTISLNDRESSLVERVWARIDKNGPTPATRPDLGPCWTWVGHRSREGYGMLARRWAHRVSYELLVGPIPDGLTIDHLCRNPSCVNPTHLEPVTMRENILRGTSPSAKHARQQSCIHGHLLSGENLYVYPSGRRACRTCREAAMVRWRKRQESLVR